MKKKVKGFTLMEMIIVLAIVGVLSAILAPTFIGWNAKSRTRKANNAARVVFNSAQTIVQEYKFRERKLDVNDRNIGDGEFYFYWDKGTGTASGTAAKVDDAAFVQDFATKLNRLYTGADETVYRIYVNNYMVQSVVAASSDTNRHKGAYPTKIDSTEGGSVSTINMNEYTLNHTETE